MSPVFAARRRAEEFDALVQRGRAAAPVTPEEERYAELLALAGALRAVPAPEPRPEFAASLRERLMAEAATELAEAPGSTVSPALEARLTVPARRTSRERRIAIAVGGFAIVGASTSMAVAAQSALPGDVLYPVKRALENAHTGVSVGDGQKAATLLGNASARLDEATALARRGDDGPALADTLRDFADQADEGSALRLEGFSPGDDARSLEDLQAFTADAFASLEEVSDLTESPEAREALVEAGNTLLGIDLALQQVCAECTSTLGQVPQWLITQAAGAAGLTQPSDGADVEPDADREGRRGGKDRDRPGRPDSPQPSLPTDIPSDLPGTAPSASPTTGSGGGTGSGGSGPKPTKGPVGTLIEDLTGGEDNPLPIVPELLAGVGDLLDTITSPLLGGLTGGERDKQ